jgi:hypothetical protein
MDNKLCGYHHVFNDHGNAVLFAAISIQTHATYQRIRWPKVCEFVNHQAAQEPNRDATT